MHQLGIVGVSHRHADARELARFVIARHDLPGKLVELRAGLEAAEVAYIGTCNRVEVVFAMADGHSAGDQRAAVFRLLTGHEPEPSEPRRVLRTWMGEAALEHLLLVACGLDSAQVGEREIAVQMRAAWDAARDAGVAGPIIDRVLGEALSMSRRVQHLEVGGGAPSLADLGFECIMKHLNLHRGAVALIGVSPMTRRCGRALQAVGVPLIVVNRSQENARELVQEVAAAKFMTLDDFRAHPADVAAVVVATGSTEPLLDTASLARLKAASTGAPIIIDFCSPPNIEPESARQLGLQRVGMDDLTYLARERRMAHLLRLAPVRAAIDERLARLRSDLAARAIGPRLGDLRNRSERIVTSEIDRLLATELRALDDAQRESLRRWGATLGRRLAHLQLSGVRAAAEHASAEALEAFFDGAQLGRSPGERR